MREISRPSVFYHYVSPLQKAMSESRDSDFKELLSWGHGWRWWDPLDLHLRCGLLSLFSYESFCIFPVLKNTVIKLGPLFSQCFVRVWGRTEEEAGTGSDLCSSLPVVNCNTLWPAGCISTACRLEHKKWFSDCHVHKKVDCPLTAVTLWYSKAFARMCWKPSAFVTYTMKELTNGEGFSSQPLRNKSLS